MSTAETVSGRTTAIVFSKEAISASRRSASRRRTHLCLLRSTCLWCFNCSVSASKAALIARGGDRALFLRGHLSGRQAQVQRHDEALARRVLLDNALDMHQIGTKDLQVLAQFFQLLFDLLFEVGSFGNLVTEMNVHECLDKERFQWRSYLVLSKVYSCWESVKQEMGDESRSGSGFRVLGE